MSDEPIIGGNGHKPTPSPEELAIAKRKAFEENPNAFIHQDDLIACAIKTPDNGCKVWIGQKATLGQYHMAHSQLIVELHDFITYAREQFDKSQKKLITSAKGGILNFARNRMK